MSDDPSLPSRVPLKNLSLFQRLLLVVIGAALLTVSSYLVIPMVPVPITMQTLAVTLIGAIYGWRLGAVTVIIWLLIGATGLPVFAGGGGGLNHITGATGGYLIAFPFGAAATGGLVARGWNEHRFGLAAAAMLVGSLVCLSVGAVWLAARIGPMAAFSKGFAPFLIGAVIKSIMGAAGLLLLSRIPARP